MLENHDAPLGARLTLAHLDNLGLSRDRIADKDRLGKFRLVETQITDRRAQCKLANRKSDDQPEGEDAVDYPLSELGVFGKFRVQMERLRIHCERGEE